MGVTGDNSRAESVLVFCVGVVFRRAFIFLYYHVTADYCDGSTASTFVYRLIYDHNFEDNMERDTVTAEKTEPASPLGKNINEDTCLDNSHSSGVGTCGTTDVARARWSLLRQVNNNKIPHAVFWLCYI